jgi:hypothetical protein
LAIVVAAILHPVARLGTIDSLVKTIGVTLVHTRVSAWETLSAQKIASSLWRDNREVVRRSDLKRGLRVSWAAQVERSPNIAIFSKDVQYLTPHWYVSRCVCVADDVHSVLSTRKQNVNPVGSPEEAAFSLLVTSHERDDDDLGFFALKQNQL